jgi:CRP-like cAMP-binding protein
MPVPVVAHPNRLIATLGGPDLARLQPNLESVWLPLGKVLHESGDRLHHVYFPTTAVVALLQVMADGRSAEVAVIGNDGMVGIALFMGGETMPYRAVVLNAGLAYRLSRPVLQRALDRFGGRRSGGLNRLLLRYAQALVTQTAQTAACNRHHSIAQQLCRCLLLSIDRLPSLELTMTQELISNLLGVRREGVTEAARKLQAAGLIEYNRGHITVLDRAGLEARACECYAVVRNEYDRLLPPPLPWEAQKQRPPRVNHGEQAALMDGSGS